MELNKTYENVVVDEFNVKRENDTFTVTFEFISEKNPTKVTLKGIRVADNLCELLEAERLWIEECDNGQLEFGRFTLGISHESYTEVTFDELG
ncbi:hypothetical protein [Thalassomonas sp. RHCl1]|uniref:hypothetical protein n=1 Tax=Thalassomonas sp. RHCl1 TaxID=2995320 RepID=UPI00248BE2F2|nr:hypothetical protein [Thalassomonas sp. RHCl1]